MMHTGQSQFVRPSLGAWTLYGLGTENENLPGFIAIKPVARNGGPQNYGSAFLPAIYQGTRIGREAAPVSSAELGNITRFLTYHQGLGERAHARSEYAKLSDEARDWSTADLEAARQACPSRLNFAHLLGEAEKHLA